MTAEGESKSPTPLAKNKSYRKDRTYSLAIILIVIYNYLMSNSTRFFVCAAIRDLTGNYLLVRRSKDSKFAADQWEFVSGSLDSGETAEQCLEREAVEEIGIHISSYKKGKVFETSDEDGNWVVLPYYVTLDDNSKSITLSHEHSEWGWFNTEQINAMPYMKDMQSVYLDSALS